MKFTFKQKISQKPNTCLKRFYNVALDDIKNFWIS